MSSVILFVSKSLCISSKLLVFNGSDIDDFLLSNVINYVRSEARYQTAIGLINGAKNYYSESWLDDSKKPQMNGETNIYNFIEDY